MGHRLLLASLIVFIGTSFLAAVLQGGGGIVSTPLAQPLTANGTTVHVSSTDLFNSIDAVRIGNEKVAYSSINATAFMVSSRGYDGTTAAAYPAGTYVYSTEAGVLNDAFGYNLGVSLEEGGMWGLVNLPINFFTKTVPHLAMLNANLFSTPALSIIAIFWYGFGIALVVVLAIQIAPIAVAALTGLFGLVRRAF